MPEPRRTPLDAVHRELGAVMTDFAGWRMPLRYGSERAEHQTVRRAAGLFDLSHMGEITVTGPGAGELLDYALVGRLAALRPGRARYTMMCTPEGGILDDLIVYRRAEDAYLVVANAANAGTVARALAGRGAGSGSGSGSGAKAATVSDETSAYALLAVQGPAAAAILARLTDADLAGLRYYAGLPATVAGRRAFLARTGYTGEDGFELFCAPEDAGPLWRALTAAGGVEGLVPCGLACRDTLRLEAGMPLYGHELTAATTPFDAGLGRVVKLDKPGDFVGRDALRAAAARAEREPPRVLAGLVGTGRRVPRAGYPVVDAAGAVIGGVTSGAASPTLGAPIAMAYLDAAHAAPGTPGVSVDIRGRHEPYDVVALPFYPRRT